MGDRSLTIECRNDNNKKVSEIKVTFDWLSPSKNKEPYVPSCFEKKKLCRRQEAFMWLGWRRFKVFEHVDHKLLGNRFKRLSLRVKSNDVSK